MGRNETCLRRRDFNTVSLFAVLVRVLQDKRFRTDHDLTIGVEFGRALRINMGNIFCVSALAKTCLTDFIEGRLGGVVSTG